MPRRFVHLVILLLGLIAACLAAMLLTRHGLLGILAAVAMGGVALLLILFFAGHADSFLRIIGNSRARGTSLDEEVERENARNQNNWVEFRAETEGVAYHGPFTIVGPGEMRQRLVYLLKRNSEAGLDPLLERVAGKRVRGFVFEPINYVKKTIHVSGWIAFNREDLELWEDKERLVAYTLLIRAVWLRARVHGVQFKRLGGNAVGERIIQSVVRRYGSHLYQPETKSGAEERK